MSQDVKVPRLAESISEAVLVEWLKPEGAHVRTDEAIVTLETDKAAVEIAAPESGVLHQMKKAGETVRVDDVIARIEAGAAAASPATGGGNGARSRGAAASSPTAEPSRAADLARTSSSASAPPRSVAARVEPPEEGMLSPAVRRLVEEHGLDPSEIEPTGRGGRLLKEDVLRHLESHAGVRGGDAAASGTRSSPRVPADPAANQGSQGSQGSPGSLDTRDSEAPSAPASAPVAHPPPAPSSGGSRAPATESRPSAILPARGVGEDERIVPMSRIRQRIAERLVRAQHTAAILTTFNEIDMTAVMELRARHRESFERRHGVRLGFMSFFARASVLALEEIPELNAEIRGTDIVYRRRVHLGVAVGTDRGLVVPVVRDAHRMGFAGIEREIARLAERAHDGTLTLDELSGGTFTISNGGVYGSLLSTPILNPPQSGILGMHKIEKRPIAAGDAVVIRPMMYVALSYDHRIVDGEQAVTFLVRVKERLEDPGRMILDV